MKYYSEILDKLYKDEQALVDAEKAYYDKIMVEKDERLKLKEQLKDARLELSKAEEAYHQAYQKVFDIYNQLADLYGRIYTRAYYVDGKKVSRKEYLKAIEEINKL